MGPVTFKQSIGIRGPAIWFTKEPYRLQVHAYDRSELGVRFIDLSQEEMMITGRDFRFYPRSVRQIVSGRQIVEIACGLGGFLERRIATDPSGPRPIAIDPANYELMREILDYAIQRSPQSHAWYTMMGFVKRIELLMDPTKVRFINKPLSAALAEEGLEGIADAVVDNYGAMRYPRTEFKISREVEHTRESDVEVLMQRLLKPNGTLIVNY